MEGEWSPEMSTNDISLFNNITTRRYTAIRESLAPLDWWNETTGGHNYEET